MQFLRTLFWVVVAVAMLIFAVQNNDMVTINLWGGLQADVKTWLLALGPLLIGFLPTWIFGRYSLWRQRTQASAAAQRAIEPVSYAMQPPKAPLLTGATSVAVGGEATSITPDGVMTSHPAHPAVSPNL